jgi:four helix bundle protein
MDLAVEVYKISSGFPNEEKFGITSQVRRSSVSVAANIAEGFGRDSKAEFSRFLKISQGSLKETETHLLLALRLGQVKKTKIADGLGLADEVGKMLRSLIAKVEAQR